MGISNSNRPFGWEWKARKKLSVQMCAPDCRIAMLPRCGGPGSWQALRIFEGLDQWAHIVHGARCAPAAARCILVRPFGRRELEFTSPRSGNLYFLYRSKMATALTLSSSRAPDYGATSHELNSLNVVLAR